jgi:hypothetical protein
MRRRCCCGGGTVTCEACLDAAPAAYQLALPRYRNWRPGTGAVFAELPAGTYLCDDFVPEVDWSNGQGSPFPQACAWFGPEIVDVEACVTWLSGMPMRPVVLAGTQPYTGTNVLLGGWALFDAFTSTMHTVGEVFASGTFNCNDSYSESFAGYTNSMEFDISGYGAYEARSPDASACSGAGTDAQRFDAYDAGTISITPV